MIKKSFGKTWRVGKKTFRYVYRGGRRVGKEVLTGAGTGLRRWVAHETYGQLSKVEKNARRNRSSRK